MSDKTIVVKSGNSIGLGALLTTLFVGLKLTGYITWSWWWVLSPLWLPITIVFGGVAVAALGALAVAGIAFLANWMKRR